MNQRVIRLGAQWTPGVKALCALFGLSFLASLLPGAEKLLFGQLVLVPSQAIGPKPWQLVTGPLLMLGANPLQGLLQLVFLGFLLYSVGSAVEARLGTARFLRLSAAASVLAALAAALIGRPFEGLRDTPVLLSAEPVFLFVLGAFAQLYGAERMTFWGVGQPVSGRVLSYFFIGLALVMHLIRGSWLDLAAAIVATAVGLAVGPGGLGGLWLRLRKGVKEWQLRRARRRYKVIDGGLRPPGARRPSNDRWVN